MKTRALLIVLALVLAPVSRAAAQSFYSFGTLRAPLVTPVPYPYGFGYGAPAYYPPPYPAVPYASYPYAYQVVPPAPYGFPPWYRGAWRTDYPWWSRGPRGYTLR